MDVSLLTPIPPLPEVKTGRAVETLGVDEPLVDLAVYSAGAITCTLEYDATSAEAPDRCWVRQEVAEKLMRADSRLPEGVRFMVFDSWRPLAVQQQLLDDYIAALSAQNPGWSAQRLREEATRFVTDPEAVVPPHSTGGSVDIALCTDGGEPLWFGTPFDEFTERSATRYFEDAIECGRELSPEETQAAENRRLLYNTLAREGFVNYPSEWWHFDYGDGFWAQATGNAALYGSIEAPE